MKSFTVKEISDTTLNEFDESLPNNTPFTQASFYGAWQTSLGRLVKRFLVYEDNEIVASYQIVRYPLWLNYGYFYLPYGPIIKENSDDLLNFIKKHLKLLARENKAVFVRLDFTPTLNSKLFTPAPKYTYHSAYFQPRYDWVLDLTPTPDKLLENMDKDTRYSIRLAERKEIAIEIITENFADYFDRFYELMSETAQRNDFSLHSGEYYKNIFANLSQIKNSFLSIAKYQEKILAINVIIVFKGVANYVYAASSSEERNRAPAYLAQWQGILRAKQLGCHSYNFGGISGSDDKHDGWEGLTFFKKNFGGREIKHSNFSDIVVNQFWYRLYCLRKLFQKIKKGV